MKPPIVVVSDDVDVFLSIADAERYLEAWEVRQGDLKIFDAEARPIRAVIARRVLAEVVKLEEDPEGEPQPDELRKILVRFLSAADGSFSDLSERTSLEELVTRAANYP